MFIAALLHATLQAEGIILVIGEVGSGKTLMSRILLSRLPDTVDTVYLPNPVFSRDEIIDVIARDLGVVAASQGMPADSIEEVRRLSNLETDNRKLLQLVLCGQPELDTLLAAPSLRQVRDRVVYRLVLNKFSADDASRYLNHRLRVAGWPGGRLFTDSGEWLLLNDAGGRARRLNLIADKALLAAFADDKKQVNAKHVLMAIGDAGANFSSAGFKSRGVQLLILALIAITVIWLAITSR